MSASARRPDAPSPSDAATTEAQRRETRLAELVASLTGCERGGALHAVREHQVVFRGDALEIVARAMVEVDGPEPEGFRVTGFIRSEHLVEHGSLRRWDRLHDERDRLEDAIVGDRFQPRSRHRV